jgi:hypothetical protein
VLAVYPRNLKSVPEKIVIKVEATKYKSNTSTEQGGFANLAKIS